ncbi:hypothetical protein [Leyella lascolaii]|uniref:Uncharacterized protein n=1 Tax=Leyella lascolaii TaxID=1776379 RepID=A0AAW7JHK7_9BACT|nr:hypothetical protein [Leyella lascolaii]MDN0023372.1 hypothetical protein [Leyella lascolaii]MDN0024735.1 hypothetical protein [Leyella lascolaii]
METKIIKFATRKDIRKRMTEDDARSFLTSVRKRHNTQEEIDAEIRKIYDSSLDVLSDEDKRGVLLFGELSGFPFGVISPKS